MSDNTESRTATLIPVAVLVIALAGVFVAGLVVNRNDDSAASVASTNTTESFGVVTAGVGKISAKPDQLTFTATVTNRRSSTAVALAATNHDVRAVTISAKKLGIADADITTQGLSVRQTYEYGRQGRHPTGYSSSEQVQILVRKLDTAGKVIGGVTIAGNNAVRVGGVQLSVSNKDELTAQARAKAVADSKTVAEALAKAAGADVGELEFVQEVVPQQNYYGYARDERSAVNLSGSIVAKSLPISPGKQDITVTVQVRWALAN